MLDLSYFRNFPIRDIVSGRFPPTKADFVTVASLPSRIPLRTSLHLLVLGLFGLMSRPALASDLAVPDAPRYAFQHYGDQLGIGSITVNTMAQDRQGFLWFGSQTGLVRFDGVHVQSYS